MNDKTKENKIAEKVEESMTDSPEFKAAFVEGASRAVETEQPARTIDLKPISAPLQQLPDVASINTMSPMQQFAEAKKLGMTLEEMQGMFTLQKDWEANEARKAFHMSLAEFKKNPPVIIKDLLNAKYGSAYSSIGNTVTKASEAMGPWGLSARWDYPESSDMNIITVTCILSHALGHEEKVTLVGGPDKEGSKNPLQERKSSRTYLKLETFEAVTGIASIAGNKDDDGNSAAPVVNRITEDQALTLDTRITDNDLNREVFVSWLSKFFPYSQGNIDLLMVEHYQKVLAKLDATIKMLTDKPE